jgi:hypothetical protein
LRAPLSNRLLPSLNQAVGNVRVREAPHLGAHLEFPTSFQFDLASRTLRVFVHPQVEGEVGGEDFRGRARLGIWEFRGGAAGAGETREIASRPAAEDLCGNFSLQVATLETQSNPAPAASASAPVVGPRRELLSTGTFHRPQQTSGAEPCLGETDGSAPGTIVIEEPRLAQMVCGVLNSEEFRKYGYRILRRVLEDNGAEFFPGESRPISSSPSQGDPGPPRD